MKALQKVHKYELVLNGITSQRVLRMPKGAVVLAVGNQRGHLMLWAQVLAEIPNEEPEFETRTFVLVCTGFAEVEPGWLYVDTAMFDDGGLVLHIYEKLPS